MEPNKSLSCISVIWQTKRPEVGEWISSHFFYFRENELRLELALNHNGESASVETRVIWRRIPSDISLFTRCFVKTDIKIFSEACCITKGKTDYYTSQIDRILNGNIKFLHDYKAKEWIVICHLSCDKPFDEHVEKNKMYVMTADDTSPSSPVDKSNREALSDDLAYMFKEGILTDFELICGGQTFPVHRFILAARSEVFRAMFLNEMQESVTGLVHIVDLEVPVLELLLKFLYSARLEDMSVETASNLYEAADKYAVKSLMTACSYYMIGNLTVENCVDYLKTADSHSDSDLKAAVASFIFRHPAVFKSPAWTTFSLQHRDLAFEILQACVESLN